MQRFRTGLALVLAICSGTNSFGAFTMDYPVTNESFGTTTRIPGYGTTTLGSGGNYSFRMVSGGTTKAVNVGATLSGNTWERIYIDSTHDNSLAPPSNGWPCGNAKIEIVYSGNVEISRDINITDSGC